MEKERRQRQLRERGGVFARGPRPAPLLSWLTFRRAEETGSDAACARGPSRNAATMERIERGGKIGLVSAAIR